MSQTYTLLEASLSSERMQTYLAEASGNKSLAAALYLWNCQLSESLQTPIHFLEVSLRNAFHEKLKGSFGEDWYDNPAIGLTGTLQTMITTAKDSLRGYGKTITPPGIISSVMFGFWGYLLANRYETSLWRPILYHVFPHAPTPLRRDMVHARLERIRVLRNRIAHHEPIFNKSPNELHNEIIELIGWIVPNLDQVVLFNSNFPGIWSKRPIRYMH